MPPNSSLSDDKPICVSDSFHFSSFYWKESSASLANLDNSTTTSPPTIDEEDDSIAGLIPRSRNTSFGSERDFVSDPGTPDRPMLNRSMSFKVRRATLFFCNRCISGGCVEPIPEYKLQLRRTVHI